MLTLTVLQSVSTPNGRYERGGREREREGGREGGRGRLWEGGGEER